MSTDFAWFLTVCAAAVIVMGLVAYLDARSAAKQQAALNDPHRHAHSHLDTPHGSSTDTNYSIVESRSHQIRNSTTGM